MQPNENKFYQNDSVINVEPQIDTEEDTDIRSDSNIGSLILICIILTLINVVLGLL